MKGGGVLSASGAAKPILCAHTHTEQYFLPLFWFFQQKRMSGRGPKSNHQPTNQLNVCIILHTCAHGYCHMNSTQNLIKKISHQRFCTLSNLCSRKIGLKFELKFVDGPIGNYASTCRLSGATQRKTLRKFENVKDFGGID